MKLLNSSFLIVFLSLLSFTAATGQKKFSTQIDFRYSLGLLDEGQVGNYNRSDDDIYGSALRITEFYSLNNNFNVGVGVGADLFYRPKYQTVSLYETIPLYAALQYMPFSCKKGIPYLFTNIGYGLPFVITNPGIMSDFGIGYKLLNSKGFGLNMQAGYNFQKISIDVAMDPQPSQYTGNAVVFQHRHSLFFTLGLTF